MGLFDLRGPALYRWMGFVCGTSFMMYGYDAGVLGGILLHQPFIDAIGLQNPGEYTVPMIASAYSLAGTITSVLVGFVSFRLGRRGTILLGNASALVGTAVQASAYSVGQLIAGRCLTGFAIGCISSSVPIYLAEAGVDTGDRGPAHALNAIMLISGVPIAYWVDYGFTKMQNQVSWRLPVALQAAFTVVGGGCMVFLPDTPRWYYARGRPAEGDAVLAQLMDTSVDDARVHETRTAVLASIAAEREASASLRWTQFAAGGFVDHTPLRLVRRLCTCFYLPFVREWMGSGLMATYSATILQRTGATPSLISLLSGVQNVVFALGCVPTYYTIERVGRRTMLLGGALGMTLLLLVFIVLVAVPQTPATLWASVALLWLYLFAMGYAYQGSVWLYCSEIPPLAYRHLGGAAASTGEWLGTFLNVFVGPIGFDRCGWRYWFWVLSGNLTAVALVYFWCPETGGRTLEAVDDLFGGHVVTEAEEGKVEVVEQREQIGIAVR